MNIATRNALTALGYKVHRPRGYTTSDPWDWIVRVRGGGHAGCARRNCLLKDNPDHGKWVPMDSTGAATRLRFDDPFAALAYVALQGWL